MKEICGRSWKTIIKGVDEVMIIKQRRKQYYTKKERKQNERRTNLATQILEPEKVDEASTTNLLAKPRTPHLQSSQTPTTPKTLTYITSKT